MKLERIEYLVVKDELSTREKREIEAEGLLGTNVRQFEEARQKTFSLEPIDTYSEHYSTYLIEGGAVVCGIGTPEPGTALDRLVCGLHIQQDIILYHETRRGVNLIAERLGLPTYNDWPKD